jgi:hypothetical protein
MASYFVCETGKRNGNFYAIYWNFTESKIEEREYQIGVTIPEYNWPPVSGTVCESIPPEGYEPPMMAAMLAEGDVLAGTSAEVKPSTTAEPISAPEPVKTTTTKTTKATTVN